CYAAPRDGAGGADGIAFADATEDLGLAQPLAGLYGHATAVGDVDADGWPDLFVGSFSDKREAGAESATGDRLLLGGPDGFRLDESFRGQEGRTSGAAFADLDGDGDLDLVVARNHRPSPAGRAPSVVLRNDGGRFTVAAEVDAERGLRSVGVLDYDRDGRLDLFLVEDRFRGGSSVLLRNEGGFRFSDVTADAGLPDDVHGLGVAAAELSGDGWPDLFVAGSNRLFVNDGAGVFREVDSDVFAWETYGEEDDPAGVAVGDVNRDGRSDLLVGQHYNSTLDDGVEVPVRLYLNEAAGADGAPRFRDVTEQVGLVGLPTKAPHVEIVDVDADGWPDILTTASANDGAGPAVFRHLGVEDGLPRFEAPEGTGNPGYWIAGATFDADRDGRLDVFLVEFDQTRTSLLLRGDGDTAHWLATQIGPAGTGGVGATVEVYRSGGLGDASELLGSREIAASSGNASGSLPAASFGLGAVDSVDLRVRLPGDRMPLELRDVPADRLVDATGTDPACTG
ncbi:MAG: FG-GAP repeat domain-containing protein, partial [Acidimicrobiia bacterium]